MHSVVLVGSEEPRRVTPNRAAKAHSKNVLIQGYRSCQAGCAFREAGGVERVALCKPESAAMPFIAPALGNDVNDSAGMAAKLGFVQAGQNAIFSDKVGVGELRGSAAE